MEAAEHLQLSPLILLRRVSPFKAPSQRIVGEVPISPCHDYKI